MRVEINYPQKEVIKSSEVKKEVLDIYLVDCSGSMGNVHSSHSKLYNVIQEAAVNIVDSVKQEVTSNKVLFVTFDDRRNKAAWFNKGEFHEELLQIAEFNTSNLNMTTNVVNELKGGLVVMTGKHGGGTALYDSIEILIDYIETTYGNQSKNVIFKIFTDGQDNESRKTPNEVAKKIKSFEEKGYVFTFVGTASDVRYITEKLSIHESNTLVHDNTSLGMKKSLEKTRGAMESYSASLAVGADVSLGFYKK